MAAWKYLGSWHFGAQQQRLNSLLPWCQRDDLTLLETSSADNEEKFASEALKMHV
jgi:hypothetical protein